MTIQLNTSVGVAGDEMVIFRITIACKPLSPYSEEKNRFPNQVKARDWRKRLIKECISDVSHEPQINPCPHGSELRIQFL